MQDEAHRHADMGHSWLSHVYFTLLRMQDEARRLAEQVRALEDARNRWNADFAAREAAVTAKEDALAADLRQKDADHRRRLAQEQQVLVCSPHSCAAFDSVVMLCDVLCTATISGAYMHLD